MSSYKLRIKNVGVGGYEIRFPDNKKVIEISSLGKMLTQDERHEKKINWKNVREMIIGDVIKDKVKGIKNKDLIFEWI